MWGGDAYLLLLGLVGAALAVVTWPILSVIYANDPKRRIRNLYGAVFAFAGYFIAAVAWLISESHGSAFRWVTSGFLIGLLAGNVFGRIAWLWTRPESKLEEAETW